MHINAFICEWMHINAYKWLRDKTKRGKNEKKDLNKLWKWQSTFLKIEEHSFNSLANHYWQKEKMCLGYT